MLGVSAMPPGFAVFSFIPPTSVQPIFVVKSPLLNCLLGVLLEQSASKEVRESGGRGRVAELGQVHSRALGLAVETMSSEAQSDGF